MKRLALCLILGLLVLLGSESLGEQEATIMPVSLGSYSVTNSLNEAVFLQLDIPATVESSTVFYFTPVESGKYTFESMNMDGSYEDTDTVGYLYNAQNEILSENDDYNYWHFRIIYELEAGKTYSLKVDLCDGEYPFKVCVRKTIKATSIIIDDVTLYTGDEISLSYTVQPDEADNKTVCFEPVSTDEYTLSSDGKIKVYKPGKYTVQGCAEDDVTVSDSAIVTVVDISEMQPKSLAVGEKRTVVIDEAGSSEMFEFKADESGKYYFELPTLDHSVYLSVFDSQWNLLCNAVCPYSVYHFYFEIEKPGTYYTRMRFYDLCDIGNFEISLMKHIPVETITIEDLTVIEGEQGFFRYSVYPDIASFNEIEFETNDDENFVLYSGGKVLARKPGIYQVYAYGDIDHSVESTATLTIIGMGEVEKAPLEVGHTETVNIDGDPETRFYSFTPKESGEYLFYTTGDEESYACLYDSDYEMLAEDDDSAWSMNFRISYNLDSGTTYYLKVYMEKVNSGSLQLIVEKKTPVEAIEINNLTMLPGEWMTLDTSVSPPNATNSNVLFQVANFEEYSVSRNGIVEAYEPGIYTVYGYAEENENITASATLKIVDLDTVKKEDLQLNETIFGYIAEEGGIQIFSFTPEEDGIYVFRAGDAGDIPGISRILSKILFDSDKARIFIGDFNGQKGYDLVGGETYFLAVRFSGSTFTTAGNFTVSVNTLTPLPTTEPTTTPEPGETSTPEPTEEPIPTTPMPHIHTLTAHSRVEATCTEDGMEAYWQCEECEKYFSDEEAKNEIEEPVVIPAKGHTPVVMSAVEPTCTETGLTEGEKCSVCEAILTAQEVVPALGHAYKANFIWDGFTCTGALVCEHDETHTLPLEVEVISAETTPAGDTTPGVRTYTATAVYEDQTYTETKTEEIPKLMVIDENGVLVKYNGTASEINVSEGVTSIGEGVFEGKSNITSVKIPSSVKTIGASAFAGTGLTSIMIPSSVTSIGASAFAGTAITSVTIPSSVTSIGANAFAGTNITEANIGESVTSIGDGAFDAGTTINTPAGSTAAEWAADHDCTVNETTPAQHTVSLTISPNTNLLLYQDVTYTVDAQGADKVKLVFGNDDEGMDITRQNAEGQWVLTWSDVFGGEIEVYAKASFDGGETWISSEKQTINFEVLGRLTFKAMPDSDTVIKGDPIVIRFSETDKIERIGNPEVSIVTDGVETGVSISESITMTQTEMTCDTTNLEAGTYHFGFWGLPAELGYPECYVTAEVTVAEETTPAPSVEPTTAPSDEPTVEPIAEPSEEPTAEPTATPAPTMPSSVTDSTGSYSIGSDGTATFSKPAGSAATVSIPATITVNGQTVRVTAIADKAFQKDKKLTTVTIGKNIKTIGKNAFANCAKLKTVKGGANVVTIKDGAFSGCKVLKTFPTMNKLQKIGANAFKGDKALAKFTLAKTVTNIGKNAFNGCAGLKTITVKTEKLTDKNVGAGAFKGITKKATFKCPKKQLKNYKMLFVKKGAPKTCKFK